MLSLALGVGTTTSVLGLVDAWRYRTMPFPQPDRLVAVHLEATRGPCLGCRFGPTLSQFEVWARDTRAVADLAASAGWWTTLGNTDDPGGVGVSAVSPGLLPMFGTPVSLGRPFTRADYSPGAPRVVLVPTGFWKGRLNGDPHVLGTTLDVDHVLFTIVGVLRPGLGNLAPGRTIWIPLTAEVAARGFAGQSAGVQVFGRLAPRADASALATQLRALVARQAPSDTSSDDGRTPVVLPLQRDWYGDIAGKYVRFLGAAVFTLLIVWANLANLFIARAIGRRREVAVRVALGANRWQLVRPLISEAALIAALASTLSLVIASWGISAGNLYLAANYSEAPTLRFDARLLAFAVTVTFMTALTSALVPAARTGYIDAHDSLRTGATPVTTWRGHALARRSLVVVQVAGALLLSTGAGLLTKSIVRMARFDPGYDTRNLVSTMIVVPANRYSDDPQRVALFDRILTQLAAVPGVLAASVTSVEYPAATANGGITVEGQGERLPAGLTADRVQAVTPGLFAMLGIPIRRGRGFAPQDHAGAPQVAIVNDEAAHRWWPEADGDVVGKRVLLGPPSSRSSWLTVVGVVKSIRGASVRDVGAPLAPDLYRPFAQAPGKEAWVTLRTSLRPSRLVPLLRAAVRDVDPELHPSYTHGLEESMSADVRFFSFDAELISTFAAFGLLLAAMGVYGVVAYTVSQRTREIGIRIALGAQRANVLSSVMRETLGLCAVGITVGLAASVGLTRVLGHMLYGTSPLDPIVYATVSLLLLATIGTASYLPARRATRVDPIIALRTE